MSDNPMQTAMQPYVKLVQSNMELLTKFSSSPEAVAQAGDSLKNLFQQNQEAASKMLQSNAFASLAQGMLKNYTEFMMELSQTSMTAMTQAQSAMTKQAQDATDNVSAISKRARGG